MKVVITGATGFIGTALCSEMIEAGHEVTAIIRPGSLKRERLPKGVTVIELELNRLSELEGKFDLFYHLAWNGSSGDDRNDFYIQNSNIVYTVEAVKAAKRCGCNKFIGAGSQAEYGVVKGVCTEETNPKPFMLYGAAKLSAYHMAKIVAEQEGISFVWPRIYSVYGVGENPGTLISYLISTLLKGESPELTSCENMWDYIYITDCVKALRLLGEKKLSDSSNYIYNISHGAPRLLKDFVKEVRDIIDPGAELKFGAKYSNAGKNYWLEPDVTKLLYEGFRPEVSFKRGITEIINHGGKKDELLG